MRPYRQLEEDFYIIAPKYLITEEVDVPGVTLSVFQLYGFHTSNIIEARYKAFMHMCSSTRKELLAKMKKINGELLASKQSKRDSI